jgi:hypothetical protein
MTENKPIALQENFQCGILKKKLSRQKHIISIQVSLFNPSNP